MGFLSDWPKKYGEAKIAGIDPNASPNQFLGQILNNVIGDKQSEDGDSIRESASPVDFIAPEAAGALRSMASRGAQVMTEAAPRILGNEIGSVGSNVKPKFDNIKQVFDNKISLHPEYDLPENTILGKQHQNPDNAGKEVGVNYRLNGINDINYAVKDGKVVGHLGVDDDGAVKTVFVDPEHRRQGVAEKMYTDYVNKNGVLKSDEPMAMEPEAKVLWKKLQSKYPNEITKGPDGWSWNKNTTSPEELPKTLDMSKEARLARAKEMGFDTDKTYYHGTKGDISQFDPEKSATSPGSFFSPNQDFAQKFSGKDSNGANVMPVYLKTDNLFDPDNMSHIQQLKDWYSKVPNSQKAYFDTSLDDIINPHPLLPEKMPIQNEHSGWGSSESGLISDFLKENGYEGQHIYEGGNKNIQMMNPSKIRSINADFNPSNIDSSDILSQNDKFEALKKLLSQKA